MVAAMVLFTTNDAFVKGLGSDIPLSQLLVMRGALASVFVAVIAWKIGALTFDIPRKDWLLLICRAGAEVGAAYYFLEALRQMEIANVTAVLQVLPLSVALGAWFFFKEPMGWRRLLAILIGFGGMLLIVRPGPDGFNDGSILAIIAVAFVTVRDLVTRRMSSKVPSMMGAFTSSVGVTLFAGLMSFGIDWVPVDGRETAVIVTTSVLIGAAYLCSVMTMRVGEITFIAPFRYTGLIWALILGLVYFDEWPDSVTLLGAFIVVATGLFTLYRETRVKAAQPKTRRT